MFSVEGWLCVFLLSQVFKYINIYVYLLSLLWLKFSSSLMVLFWAQFIHLFLETRNMVSGVSCWLLFWVTWKEEQPVDICMFTPEIEIQNGTLGSFSLLKQTDHVLSLHPLSHQELKIPVRHCLTITFGNSKSFHLWRHWCKNQNILIFISELDFWEDAFSPLVFSPTGESFLTPTSAFNQRTVTPPPQTCYLAG